MRRCSADWELVRRQEEGSVGGPARSRREDHDGGRSFGYRGQVGIISHGWREDKYIHLEQLDRHSLMEEHRARRGRGRRIR